MPQTAQLSAALSNTGKRVRHKFAVQALYASSANPPNIID